MKLFEPTWKVENQLSVLNIRLMRWKCLRTEPQAL